MKKTVNIRIIPCLRVAIIEPPMMAIVGSVILFGRNNEVCFSCNVIAWRLWVSFSLYVIIDVGVFPNWNPFNAVFIHVKWHNEGGVICVVSWVLYGSVNYKDLKPSHETHFFGNLQNSLRSLNCEAKKSCFISVA